MLNHVLGHGRDKPAPVKADSVSSARKIMISPNEVDNASQNALQGDSSGGIEQRQNPIIDLLVVAIIYVLFAQLASVVLEKLSLISYVGVRWTVEATLDLLAIILLNSKYPLDLQKYDKQLVLRFALIGIILCFIRYIPFFLSLIANPRITADYSKYLNLSGIHFIWSLILMIIVGPLTEEFIFRGFIYRLVQQKTSIITAAIISSLLFAAVHGIQTGWIMNHFLLGLFCCYVYSKSNSIWSSVLTHIGNNAIWYLCTGLLVNKF